MFYTPLFIWEIDTSIIERHGVFILMDGWLDGWVKELPISSVEMEIYFGMSGVHNFCSRGNNEIFTRVTQF